MLFRSGNLVYSFSTDFLGLISAQCLYVLARSTFWPATYALGSRLPGDRSRNMGWLNSVTNGGMIGGTGLGGLCIGLFGYQACFWIAVGFLILSVLLGLPIKGYRSVTPPGGQASILSTHGKLARMPAMYFAVACAYISILPFTLASSFYPVLLVGEGFSTVATGWLLALRALGSILAGIGLTRTVRSPTGLTVPVCCGIAIALSIPLAAASESPWVVGFAIFVFGLASGLLSIYFQLLVSAVSTTQDRGSAISFGGLGWQASNISTPLLMGMMMDAIGLQNAFYVMGAGLMVLTVLLPPLHRWSLAGRTFAESR